MVRTTNDSLMSLLWKRAKNNKPLVRPNKTSFLLLPKLITCTFAARRIEFVVRKVGDVIGIFCGDDHSAGDTMLYWK